MLKSVLQVTIFIFFIFSVQFAYARPDVYEIKVPIENQTETEKRKALKKALGDILVQYSGKTYILSEPKIKTVLDKSHDYLQSYQYLSTQRKGKVVQRYIKIQFAKEEIDQILTEIAQLPLPKSKIVDDTSEKKKKNVVKAASSSASEPVLFWLLVKSQGQDKPVLVTSEAKENIYQAIIRLAKQQAIDVFIPESNKEKVSLNLPALWNFNMRAIQDLSSHYQVSRWVVGRLEQLENEKWQGKWLFRLEGIWTELETKDENIETSLKQVMGRFQKTAALDKKVNQAQKLEKSPNNSIKSWLVKVNHIDNLDKNAELLAYLKQLSMVKEVEIVQIHPESVILKIEIAGDQSAFEAAVKQDEWLFPKSKISGEVDLEYDWKSTTHNEDFVELPPEMPNE
jgi:uncharacterized protein